MRDDASAQKVWYLSLLRDERTATLADLRTPPRGARTALVTSAVVLAGSVVANQVEPSRAWLSSATVVMAAVLLAVGLSKSRWVKRRERARHAQVLASMDAPGSWAMGAPEVLTWVEELDGVAVRETFEALAATSTSPVGEVLAAARALESG